MESWTARTRAAFTRARALALALLASSSSAAATFAARLGLSIRLAADLVGAIAEQSVVFVPGETERGGAKCLGFVGRGEIAVVDRYQVIKHQSGH